MAAKISKADAPREQTLLRMTWDEYQKLPTTTQDQKLSRRALLASVRTQANAIAESTGVKSMLPDNATATSGKVATTMAEMRAKLDAQEQEQAAQEEAAQDNA